MVSRDESVRKDNGYTVAVIPYASQGTAPAGARSCPPAAAARTRDPASGVAHPAQPLDKQFQPESEFFLGGHREGISDGGGGREHGRVRDAEDGGWPRVVGLRHPGLDAELDRETQDIAGYRGVGARC